MVVAWLASTREYISFKNYLLYGFDNNTIIGIECSLSLRKYMNILECSNLAYSYLCRYTNSWALHAFKHCCERAIIELRQLTILVFYQ